MRRWPRTSPRSPSSLGADFKAATGHDVVFSFGATGALYTQITQAAPFDVFFSADAKRTATAIDEGFGVAGTDFTYAVGKVVLYSPTLDVTDGAAVLRSVPSSTSPSPTPRRRPTARPGWRCSRRSG